MTNLSHYLIGPNGQKYALAGKMVIGRDATQCQIVLDQSYISRLQAVIEVHPDGMAAIKNLSNRETTFVNGQAIITCALNDGDSIEMGAGQTVGFTFHKTVTAAPAYEPQFSFSSIPIAPFSGDETVVAADEAESATSIFQVKIAPSLRIGRAPDNEIILDAPS
ncbi:MAG TPA: FHA domain-containing protein, partial [Nitrosospira sp.]|nr:FHA domain-containing protein [Nitrosospira sp.]